MDCRTNNEMEASRKPIKDLQIATRYLYIVNTEHKTQTLGGGGAVILGICYKMLLILISSFKAKLVAVGWAANMQAELCALRPKPLILHGQLCASLT